MKELVFGHKTPIQTQFAPQKHIHIFKISAVLKLKPLPWANLTKRQSLFWIISKNQHLA